jgi:hypothetical protein
MAFYEQRAPACPYCGRRGGEAHHPDHRDVVVRVSIRCDWCRRRWSLPIAGADRLHSTHAAGKGHCHQSAGRLTQ